MVCHNILKNCSPIVSVVIPVYNVIQYLTLCLDSVLSQTYRNLDILLIDDGSTDGSSKICDEYAKRDGRIRVFHTTNHGLSAARNLGIENATGEFLMFIDSDDWVEKNAVEILLELSMKTTSDIAVACFYREFTNTSSQKKQCYETQVVQGMDILSLFASGMLSNVVWNKLYRKACFRETRFPDGHVFEDVFTLWRILTALAENNRTIVVLPNCLFHYRMRKSSISHQRSLYYYSDRWKACREKFDALSLYQDRLLPECMNTIGATWCYFAGFSSKEREQGTDLLQEMRDFSRKHFRTLFHGKYRTIYRIICILSLNRSPVLLWLCFQANNLRKAIKNKEQWLFD